MSFHGKAIREISPKDIWELISGQTPEDAFIEFKSEIFNPSKPPSALDQEGDDIIADLVAFANAQGGHVIIGVRQDDLGRAQALNSMTGDQADKIAKSLRDRAIQHIKPAVLQLEVRPFSMREDESEWVVIAAIPDSGDKPHMSSYNQQTRFEIRVDNRKRKMTFDEIRGAILGSSQQALLTRIVQEVQDLKSLVSNLQTTLGNRGD